jgi:hypothetical protein
VRRLHTLAFAFVVGAVVTACAPDGLTRETGGDGRAGLQGSNIGDADLVALVEADLTCLYSKAGLLPNESSSLGKFRTVVASVLAGDPAGAQTDADKLIKFIELKYSQYGNQNGTVDCGAPIGVVGITELKERAVARINAYVTLGGNVCEIPDGSPETFCRTSDDQTAIVYFPAGIFAQLTYVSLEENPPGFTRLQELGFDEYPTYVRIITQPLSNFEDDNLFPLKPLVVVCFNEQVVPNDQALRERLLLGHRHTEENGDVTFKLLPTPNYAAYDADVLTEATNFCGAAETASVGAPFSPSTLLGRVGNRVASFLAPAPLQASAALAFRGVGGSAEEFSEFGAIDRGFTGRGGVGGSAEEFNRASNSEGLASATVSGDGTTVTGKVGVDNNVTDPAELPTVRVIAPGTGTPVAGVKVLFELKNPVQAQYSPASNASFCGATEAITDANGQASPPCLNFGNTVGFKNLKVTFDPTPVDPEACIIDDATGACAPATALNFLIATIAGDPAKLAVINSPGATSAQAGVAMVDQPILQVQDAGGNAVTNLAADVPVDVSVKQADGTPGGSIAGASSTTNKALGQVTLAGLALGGTVGTTYRLTFASGALGVDSADVVVSAPGAAANLAVMPATATAPAGGVIPTITATVTDAFGNGVPGVTVNAATTDLGCFTAATDCTAETTGATGAASFGDLAVRGPGLSRTLTFSASGLTSQTVALTLMAGAPTLITAVNPAGGDYGTNLPIGIVSPNPTARVTDAYGNAVANASVLWQLQSLTNGATVSSSSTTTSAAGTTAITWRLGDGDNGLRAYLGSTASGSAYAQFTAATTTGGVALSCNAGNRLRKTDLASYDASRNGYVGTFSMQPELAARFRSLRLFMSITGQSSGTGDYPAVVKVYRGSKSPANLIATGVPTNPNGIQLDGNNGTAAPVDFTLTPNPNATVAQAGNSNFVLIELEVTAPSTRTLQIWYNQPAGGGTCGSTFLYAPGVTDFQNAPSRDKTPGVLIRVRN